MSQVEGIIRMQNELYGRIARAVENLKKSGPKATLSVVEARLQSLEANWAKFEAHHEKIVIGLSAETLAQLDYAKQELSSLAEEAYLQQKSQFLDLIRQLKAEEKLPPTTDVAVPAVAPPRSTLPRIQLPQFSGKYEDWPAFRDLFSSIIGRDKTTTPVEKLHYLRTCLKGEAELLVRNLPSSGENYEPAWKILKDYYENKRLLVRAYLSSFVALKKMKAESAAELRGVLHGFKTTVSSLEGIGRPITSSEDLFIYMIVELLDARSRREWENSIGTTTEPPASEELLTFLDRRLHTLEALQPAKSDVGPRSVNGSTKVARSHLARKQEGTPSAKNNRCSLCSRDHFVMFCPEYVKRTALDRKQHAEVSHLCVNCLGRHGVSDCTSKRTCSVCSARHHTSLHDAYRAPEVSTVLVAQRPTEKSNAVILATARIRVTDRLGHWQQTRALVDQGSESSLISERLAQKLRLARLPASVAIVGVGGRRTNIARGRVTLLISPRLGGPSLSVSALILPRLTGYSGGAKGGTPLWQHVRGLELADPDFRSADPIDVLLGADVYAAILRQGLCKGSREEPIAQNTQLGWILSGVVGDATSANAAHFYQCRVEEDLTNAVRRFWEQEEAPSAGAALSQADLDCEEHYVRTHSRAADGRYTVRLPIIHPLPDLSSTRSTAARVLKSMESRFSREARFQEMYRDFLRQYAELGHLASAPPLEDPLQAPVCYLPHHGVLREASSSTKLRVVFNGSSPLPSGDSLNAHLHAGPNLLPMLADILLRWRRHRYVLAADVEKMFRQINVHPQDQDLQRILWRKEPRGSVQEFKLKTVTYGLACAPFLAIRTLRQLADDEETSTPLGAAVLRQDIYMDDILTGAESLERAQELRRQVATICTAGGFPLKKWSSNEASLLANLPREDRLQQEPRGWQPGESQSTLGLRWHPIDDCFAFTTRMDPVERFSKRTALSLTARLFDPLGWLAPVTIRAKISIQSMWLLGIDWDAPLPERETALWRDYQAELPTLERIRVPRRLATQFFASRCELHGFADASERAYAAVIYLRAHKENGEIETTIVTAKTKVAPIKQVTLPRLELCAAVLLTRLAVHVRRVLAIPEVPVHLWSDSTVALGWIRGHPATWKTYVANRVSEVQTSLANAIWHHVPGEDNPADCASRGLAPSELESHPLWWQGPSWLRETAEWPSPWNHIVTDGLPEHRVRAHAVVVREELEEPGMLSWYSSLSRLLRFTTLCRRWKHRRRSQPDVTVTGTPSKPIIQADDLADAQLYWIQLVQAEHYRKELAAIERRHPLPPRGELTRLSPFLDPRGILRVGGRLRNAPLSPDQKHPVILPSASRLTRLVIEAYHRRTLHGGVQQTLGALRQEFWVPRGRSLVKRCILRCLTCVRWRAASPQPLMGDLPLERVTPGRPFQSTGIDYAGPVWLRTSKGRGQQAAKAFIAVFVCLSTRAVHLDVVSDYTTEAFLAALRRFVARRGLCHTLWSDRGTNFVGADAQLRDLFAASHRDGPVARFLAAERVRWRFNPPAAPNFGGIWEAAVKSTKHHLRRVIGESKLTYEEMATLLAQVEACLNSRPLQAVSDDPEDYEALTPGHFIIGAPLNAVPEPSLTELPASRLSRWQLIQQMKDHFWNRWTKEYLHTLSHRPKWFKVGEEISVGRLCLIRSEVTAPTRWPLARVEQLHPGADGHTRVVTLRTATSRLTRPVSKLVLLPVSSEKANGACQGENSDL